MKPCVVCICAGGLIVKVLPGLRQQLVAAVLLMYDFTCNLSLHAAIWLGSLTTNVYFQSKHIASLSLLVLFM